MSQHETTNLSAKTKIVVELTLEQASLLYRMVGHIDGNYGELSQPLNELFMLFDDVLDDNLGQPDPFEGAATLKKAYPEFLD